MNSRLLIPALLALSISTGTTLMSHAAVTGERFLRTSSRIEPLNGFAGVAQISNLLYRRASSLRDLRIVQCAGKLAGLPIGKSAIRQIGNLRYEVHESRLTDWDR